jgi:ATP/ADP translocase/HEAT repeat protein
MKRFVQAIFGLRKGERGLSLLMFAYIFWLLVTLYLLKPVRDSMFLSDQGSAELPYVFILTSLVVIPASMAYARASRTMRMSRLINGVSLFLVGNLVLFYWLVGLDVGWVYYVFYAWVSIYGVLVTSQFWLLANTIFEAAQAKRVFAMLSLGAILGSAAGGEITGLLTDSLNVSTNHLILIAAAVLAATIGLVNGIRYKYRQEMAAADGDGEDLEPDARSSSESEESVLTTLGRSHHLRLIVGLIAITVLTTTFIDFQFKTEAAQFYETESNLTTFMGRFYGRVSLVAFVLQVVFGSQLIQRIGVGGSLLALPVCLVGASVGMLAAPGLIAATFLRGSDQSLKHSVDKTGRELLFLPVSTSAKKRVKVFIDLFVDHGAQGLAGLLMILFTIILNLTTQQVSIVVLALLACWIAVAVLARNSYVNGFREMLHHQAREEERPQREAPTTIEDFQEILNERSKSHVLSWLEDFKENAGGGEVSASELGEMMEHESAEVRRRTLQVLRLQAPDAHDLVDPVAAHLKDNDPDVRLAAARYVFQQLDGSARARLPLVRRGLRHSDFRIRASALGLIAREGRSSELDLLEPSFLRRMVNYEGEAEGEVRSQVAHVLGRMSGPAYMHLLRRLLHDDDPTVARQAIESAGRTHDRSFVPMLLDLLEDERYKAEAREALVQYGSGIAGTVYDYLNDEGTDLELRCRLPDILAERPSQISADVLLISLGRVAVPVRHRITHALAEMHRQNDEMDFNWETIRAAVKQEIQRYGALGQIVALKQRASRSDAAVAQFPRSVLDDARRDSLTCILQLLGLRYDPDDTENALNGLTSDDRSVRSGAVEFLDSLLKWELKKLLIPLLDDPDGEQAVRKGPGLLDIDLQRWEDGLHYMLNDSAPQLKVQAINSVAAGDPDDELMRRVKPALQHANAQVRRAAERALQVR